MIAFVEPEGAGKELVVVNFKVLSQRPYNRLVLQGITFLKLELCVFSITVAPTSCVRAYVCVCMYARICIYMYFCLRGYIQFYEIFLLNFI
jgi:hypothetical protein